MAHYALINDSNTVTNVIVGADETTTAPDGFDNWEDFYSDRYDCSVKRTSVNTFSNEHTDGGTAFRGNYAGIGFIYDTTNDVFYETQPFASWSISADTNWIWKAPIEQPTITEEQGAAGAYYKWNEEAYQADNSEGWELEE
tara:strand:- start:771 stop:1193 length:423 start_codon:yes stop_codon:yes gene_type:complete